MLDRAIDVVNERTPVVQSGNGVVVVAALFLGAWLVARLTARVAERLLAWHDRRHAATSPERTAKIAEIKRRETLVRVIQAAITYAGFATAIVLSVAHLVGGVDRLAAFAGASFALVVAGFALQRLLVDMLAGLSMLVERWYSVGDTINIPSLELQGVVEEMSLRRTKLRTLDGEVIHVHNGQIPAVRVLPWGAKDLGVELFVNDRERAEALVGAVASMLPEGPTTFVARPSVEQVDDLGDTLVRIRLRATVAPGREWLAEGLLATLLKERAGEELIVHGPVVLGVDESATKSFARASAAMRWRSAAASR